MKNRNLILLPVALTICFVAVTNFFFSTKANTVKEINDSFTTDKARKSGDVPDYIAYELFLRTVADGNARGLIKRAGFDDDEVEKIMSEAYSLNSILESADRKAREIKENRSKLSKSQTRAELLNLQGKKDEIITRVVNRYLPSNLRNEGMNKLRNFINSDVKRKIQVISSNSPQKSEEVSFVRTSNKYPPMTQSTDTVYLYSIAWQDGMTVFGSGALSEQYTSQTSYRATTTVTAPSGRLNLTQSDWSYATLTNSAGLSIDVEDGTYSIQTNFEEQQGYYDEYGSFYGSGSSLAGSSISSYTVAPTVSITGVDPSTDVELRPGESKTFRVAVQATGGVATGTTVDLEFNEVANFNDVNYSLDDRTKRFSFGSAGTTVNTSFRVSVNSASPPGNVLNKARIDRAVAPNGTEVAVGTRESGNISFTVRSSPTSRCNECFDPTPGCPCYQGDGGFGSLRQSCSPPPKFVKAGFPSKKSASPLCICTSSPILLDIAGNGFAVTSAANGVPFDFNGDGIMGSKLAWTVANSDDAWLVLDRNQNKRVDNGQELFGNATPQPPPPDGEERHGFRALAEYDKPANGGNGDGKITRSDSVFGKLRLWQDKNHNGISEAEELSRLPALDVVAFFLDYQESRRTDEYGNQFKYRAKVRDAQGARVGRWAWDVFLTTAR